MLHTTISIVAAMDQKRGIGKDNKLPWHIPEDLLRFKKLTSGHTIIMGRKTYESIGHPLPDRTNIIITHNSSLIIQGALIARSLEEALQESIKYQVLSSKYEEKDKKIHNTKYKIHNTEHEAFVIGGGQIFAQALPLADKLYLTIVKGDYHADTFFPDYSQFTKVVFKEEREDGQYKFTFLDLEKTPS